MKYILIALIATSATGFSSCAPAGSKSEQTAVSQTQKVVVAEESAPADAPVILWSESHNGLSLGIAKSSTLIFKPSKNWSGPLISREEDTSGSITMKSNPGGRWSKSSTIKVFIKNTSDKTIWWALDRDVWKVVLSGSNVPKPKQWLGPMPPPIIKGPIRLDPGEQSHIQLHVEERGDIWPLVYPGKYKVTVTYSPNKLLTYAVGGEGNYTMPYDVPGFWRGTIKTPVAIIKVEQP